MTDYNIGLKIDVDTDHGTRDGVPDLMRLLDRHQVRATFLLALGPDNTGRALRRIFRPGFLSKVKRTSVISTYGLKTLGNGVLWPGPHIGKKHAALMRSIKNAGHEVGIHCYDHILWQDKLHTMSPQQVSQQVEKAVDVYSQIFGEMPRTMGSAGWQASAASLKACDDVGTLLYASDTRGTSAFYPSVNSQTFRTMQLPSTMPTLDEVLGIKPFDELQPHWDAYLANPLRIFTLHAELEGGPYQEWFGTLLGRWKSMGFHPCECAQLIPPTAPVNVMNPFGTIPGRSGTLAVQMT